MERVLGIHRNRRILPFERESFSGWWSRNRPASSTSATKGKVALFPSCMVNHQATDVGKSHRAGSRTKRNRGCGIPESQQCCGMPLFDLGDTQGMIQAAERNYQTFQPYLDTGYDVVVPTASCSLMLKREYPYLHPKEYITNFSERTFDICEYVMRLKREGKL